MSLALLALACSHKSPLASLALRQMPTSLDAAMREQMETVEAPIIKGVRVIYDTDTLCVVQCKAKAKDAYGMFRSETIRYFFVEDTFVTHASGEPSYGDLVAGGKYLKGKAIKAFQKEMDQKARESYLYYLSASRPVVISASQTEARPRP